MKVSSRRSSSVPSFILTLVHAAPVTVIPATEMEQSTAREIPELRRTHAGVHLLVIAGNRRSYRVDLRGFGETASSNTIVLVVDGRAAR